MSSILTPWNLASYQRIGGFPPLLREWMRRQAHQQFLRPPWGHEASQVFLDAAIPMPLSGAGGYRSLAEHPYSSDIFTVLDLEAAAKCHAAFELLHTVPLTLGERPFVFYCPSVADLFIGFAPRGMPVEDEVLAAVLPVFREIFESENCLAVLFHCRAELDDFAALFPEGEAKSHLMMLAAPAAYPPPRARDRPLTLLFADRSDRGSKGALLCGLAGAVAILDTLRRASPEARLIVACPGARAALAESTATGETLGNNAQNVIWVDDWVEDSALDRLMLSADVLLLTGCEGDPHLVLRAMGHGCIPVTANWRGADELINSGYTGVVLDLLDDDVLIRSQYGFTYADHQAFLRSQENVQAKCGEALAPWTEMLTAQDKRVDFREGMIRRAEQRFQGYECYLQMTNLLHSHVSRYVGTFNPFNVDMDHDFGRQGAHAVLEIAGKKIMSFGPGYLIESGTVGAEWVPTEKGQFFSSIPQAAAHVFAEGPRTLAQRRRDELAIDPCASVSPDGPVEPLAFHSDLSVRALPLDFEHWPQPTEGGSVRQMEDGCIAVLPSRRPWVYGMVAPVDPAALAGGGWLVVEMGPTSQPFSIGLLNAEGDDFACKVQAPPGKDSLQVWLPVQSQDISAIVLQNGIRPLRSEVVVRRMLMVGTPRDGPVAIGPKGVTATLAQQTGFESAALDFSDPGFTPYFGGDDPVVGLGDGTLKVLPPAGAWRYGVTVPLGAFLTKGDDFIVIQLHGSGQAFGVGLIEREGSQFTVRLKTPEGLEALEVWLPFDNPSKISALVIHNWETPLTAQVIVSRISIVNSRPDGPGLKMLKSALRRLGQMVARVKPRR